MDLKAVVERIDERLAALDMKAATASREAGLSPDAIRNMRRALVSREAAGVSTNTIAALAPVLRTTPGWLLEGVGERPSTVPLVGKAGAGPDGSVAFANSDGEFGEADAPLNATQETRALTVEGTSMRGVAEPGSLIFYDEREAPNETHIGELCICWLEDERVLVKYPYHSSTPGLWNLESTTAPTLRDAAVRYFAHVINIVPRRAARRMVRRDVTVRPMDVIVSQ